ncbi:MAG: hypothetical protein GC206_00265 [Alphaproteobacteria bacterium]|nr:hypothetical protein [Alphaproteobacteria bacterium]
MARTVSGALAAMIVATGVIAAAGEASAEQRGRRGEATIQTERGTYQARSEVRRERGARTRERSVIGPNGGETSVRDARRWNAQEGTYNRDRQRTFANGDTRSVDVDAQRTAPGEWTAQRQVTGRNGETRMQTGDFAGARTENGRVVTGDIQTQNHGQVDYQREVTRENGARTVTSSATFEDGTQVSRTAAGACDGAGNCVRDSAVTNRQGGTTTWTESRTRTENGATYSRDATFADGSTRSVDAERVGNGDGTGSVERTVTGRNGETRRQSGTYSVRRRR